MRTAPIGQHAAPPLPPVGFPDAVSRLYQVRGIDVSHYQAVVDWPKVARAGVSFAYMKATEGDDRVDDRFAANWKEAAAAGIPRGAYQFFNFCRPAAAQAELFLKTVPADADALPVAIDLERSRSCRKLPAKAAFLKNLDALTAQLAAAYGKQPVLYVTYDIYAKYLAGDKTRRRLWLTDYRQTPELPDNHAWVFWQFSEKGRLDGIDGYVDLDVFNGDRVALARLGFSPALEQLASR